MAFGQKPPSASTKPERRAYNLSGAVPVPFGRVRLSMRLLCDRWNITENDEGQKRAKSYWYSIAGFFGVGPVEWLEFWVAGNQASQRIPLTGPVTAFSIPYGDLGIRGRIYRGDIDQPVDPRLSGTAGPTLSGAGVSFVCKPAPGSADNPHPNYSGICYVVFDVFCPGWGVGSAWEGGSSIPNIEAVTYALPESITLGDESETYGVNPIAIGYELLANPRWGQGMPESVVPLETYRAAAERFRDERGPQAYLSGAWAQRNETGKHLADLLDYFRGFRRIDNGVLTLDWLPADGTVTVPDNVPTISEQDMDSPLETEDGGWEDTISEVTVKFTDGSTDTLGEASPTVRSPYNAAITGEPKREEFSIPWILAYDQAIIYANAKLADGSLPTASGRVSAFRAAVRQPDGKPLMPGDLVWINHAGRELNQLSRIIERNDGKNGAVTLKFEREAGQWPTSYEVVQDERTTPTIDPPETVTHCRPWQVPAALIGETWPQRVLLLAERPNNSVTTARAWISGTGAFEGEEAELERQTRFAMRGSLPFGATASDSAVTFTTGNGDYNGLLSRSFSAAEQDEGAVLLLVGSELMALGALQDADTDSRTYQVRRACYGTTAAAAAEDAEVWLFRKPLLEQAITHATIASGMAYFRLQAASLTDEATVSETFGLSISPPQSQIQYSTDGLTWHDTYQAGDVYLRNWLGFQAGGQWSDAVRIKGEQGEAGPKGDKGDQGEAGQDGADGQSLFTWVAFADNSTGTVNFTTGAPGDRAYIGLAYNKTTQAESSNPADYAWTQIRGSDGQDGQDALNRLFVHVYKRSTNSDLQETPTGGSYDFAAEALTPPSGWSTAIPANAAAGYVYTSTALAAAIGNAVDSALVWSESRRLTDDMILEDGSVDESKLASNAVTADKLASNAITAGKIAANAVTAEKMSVGSLQSITSYTGALTVSSYIRSSSYSAGQTGYRINSDGSAEFNQLTLRKGIITPGDILLSDPSVLCYNPYFLEPTDNATAAPDGWTIETDENASNTLQGAWYRSNSAGPGGGFGMVSPAYFRTSSQGLFQRLMNRLSVPCVAGEKYYIRATVKGDMLGLWLAFVDAAGTWIGNSANRYSGKELQPRTTYSELATYYCFESTDSNSYGMQSCVYHAGLTWVAINEAASGSSGWPAPSTSGAGANYWQQFDAYDQTGLQWRTIEYIVTIPTDARAFSVCLFRAPTARMAFCGGIAVRPIVPSMIGTVPAPQISPTGRTFSGSLNVPVPENKQSAWTCRYTLDGSDVTEFSPTWNAPLNITGTTTLKARFWDDLLQQGPQAMEVYTSSDATPDTPYVATHWSGNVLHIDRITSSNWVSGWTLHLEIVDGGSGIYSASANNWAPPYSELQPGTTVLVWAEDGNGVGSAKRTISNYQFT